MEAGLKHLSPQRRQIRRALCRRIWENGKKRYRSIYGKTYTEVKDKLLKIKAMVITPNTESGLTVKELFAEWLSAKQSQTKASTYANYAFKVEKHLIPAFGSLKIEKLSPSKVYDFIMEKRSKCLSNKYISDPIIVLKNMTRYAAKVHHCVNPIADVGVSKQGYYKKSTIPRGNSRLGE